MFDFLTIAIAAGVFALLFISYKICSSMSASITARQVHDDWENTRHPRDGGVFYGGTNKPGVN